MWPFPNCPPPNHIRCPPFFPFSCSSPISSYPNLKTLSSLCFFMAESFHLHHVPHQSRRDKLRVTPAAPSRSPFQPFNPDHHHHQLPFYDPSDLLTCGFHSQSSQLLSSSEPTNANPPSNFMGFLGNPQNQGLSLSLSSETHIPIRLNFHHLAPGPFTGYASVLKTSMFLGPAQQLLQEICDASGLISLDSSGSENLTGLDDTVERENDGICAKSSLISMLDEVYKKYKIYSHQLQAVVASFESIPGLKDAAPFANFALKALSKHFKSLKFAIIDQLQFVSKAPGSLSGRKHGYSELDGNDKFALCSQSPGHNNARIVDNHPVWRPHRGLPERAVSVLRSWLFEHFLHPYPTDTDKLMLAKQTGLSRSQVSNWFINARVRLWKPMVEEIHALESRQQAHQKASSSLTAPPGDSSNESDTFAAPPNSLVPGHTHANPFSSLSAPPDNPPEKRFRNDLVDLQYGHFNSGVSLTLALHHNNGMSALLEPFPVARHYGIPSDHDLFGVQNQRFGGGSNCRSAMG